MNGGRVRDAKSAHMEVYKNILRDVLENRPSGTRQRIAVALGKNRSFVSQMSNPASVVPIPAPHLKVIFEICHFPELAKRTFLDAFAKAHPRRIERSRDNPILRSLKLEVLDFGDPEKNRAFDELVRDATRHLARIVDKNL